jgi:hypothetical protein
MLDFLWDNRSWLFEGLGVVVLVGLSGFLYRRFFMKDQPTPSHVTVVQVIESSKSSAAAHPTQGSIELTRVTRLSPLSFDEILAALKDAPPLQVEAIGERFNGITVQWRTQIYSIEKVSKDTVRLTLHFGPGKPGLIFCEVALNEYKELAYLKKESPVTVQGVVERTGEKSVTLKNAELFFTDVVA